MVENAEHTINNEGSNKKFEIHHCLVTLMIAVILAFSLTLAITLKSFYYVATAFPLVILTSLVSKISRIRCRNKGEGQSQSTDNLESESTLLTTVQ